ncbi:MAG: secretin and TonB N-terminal domain-containing protein, partial [Serratia marcescens]|nr:secretin and TonB N-terminal domain-containing protein [Serratia marcescens]
MNNAWGKGAPASLWGKRATPLAVAIGLAFAAPLTASAASAAAAYHIPAGELDGALNAFAARAGIALSMDGTLTAGKRSPGLSGSYGVDDGLNALLAGSGLQAIALGNNGYTLAKRPQPQPQKEEDITVVGDWLAEGRQVDVFDHPGARDVVRREEFAKTGTTAVREALNRVP